MQTNPAISVTAPAKVNLFLHVTGRRDDGYHLLESLFVFTSKGDKITVEPAETLAFSLTGTFAGALGGAADDNLVIKAAKAMATAAGIQANALIRLEKNLPIASGIGGGSADAAATLLALNTFWRLNWPVARLESIALGLGADVPACLYPKPLFVRGVGEKLTPVEVPWLAGERGILLVNPGVALSTPAVFKAYKASQNAFDATLPEPGLVWQDPAALGSLSRNSLEAPAISLCPEIGHVLAALEGLEGIRLARMSGSGATCFGLFDTADAASKAAENLAARQPDWWLLADKIAVS